MKIKQTEELLTPMEVSRRLGISTDAIKTYDEVLKPYRTPTGWRIYSSAAVEAFRKRREAAKAARAQR